MTGQPDAQAPALNRRRVGDYVVTYLSDGFLDGSFDFFAGIEPTAAAALMAAARRPPKAYISIASFVVQGNGRTILIDGGTGGFSGWGGRFGESLAIAGVAPEDVDTILLTHAHVDHVGGLTKDGKALFPKAEVVINEAEVRFWRDDTILNSVPDHFKPFFEAARLALDAYGPNLRQVGAGEVVPDIDLVPLPGHTPGHSGYHIKSGKDQLLIWGDVTHLPDIQIAKPEVTIAFDTDADQARATRLKVLDQVATDRLLVAGSHLNLPGFITVDKHGSGYVKVEIPWTPVLV